MKKTFVYSLMLLGMVFLPASSAAAQSKPLFPLNSLAKSTEVPVAPILPAPVSTTVGPAAPFDITEDALDLTDIKNQPLPIRRQLVAAALGDIELRLNVLYDKTKTATDRLTQNGITTDDSQAALAAAALSLANAKLTTDALALAANDPANETAVVLLVDGVTFKDGVIKAEDTLRAARESIITSLLSLKAAVSASITTEPAN